MESEIYKKIPSRPASLSRPNRAAAATLTVLAHPRTRATVHCWRRSAAPPAPAAPSCRRHTGAPQARLDPPPRTAFAPQARLDPPRGWRAGSAWAPAGSHCGLRGRLRHRRAARSEPIVHALQVPRPTPPSSVRASRLLRLSRALRVAPLSASRGPAPAVHACPRQRLGLGRSALVGDVAAAARREPRRRPGAMANGSRLPHLVSGS